MKKEKKVAGTWKVVGSFVSPSFLFVNQSDLFPKEILNLSQISE